MRITELVKAVPTTGDLIRSFDWGEELPQWAERAKLRLNSFSQIAGIIANLGTCNRAKVGAIVLNDNWQILSEGYVGTPSGSPHCSANPSSPFYCGPGKRCLHTLHAEANALSYLHSSQKPVAMFCTHMSCLNCLKLLIAHDIRYVFFQHPYTSMPAEEMEAWKRLVRSSSISFIQL